MPLCPPPILLALNACEGVIQLLLARVQTEVSSCECHPKKTLAQTKKTVQCTQGSVLLNSQNAYNLELLAFESVVAPAQGVEIMMPTLQNMCTEQHIEAKQIKYIACARGPGSFTGVRLGLSTSAGLARACGALQGGINYLWLLALQGALVAQGTTEFKPASDVLSGNTTQENPVHIMAVTHARRDLVHAQYFIFSSLSSVPTLQNITPQSTLLVLSPHELVEYINSQGAHKKSMFLLGSGCAKNQTIFAQLFAQLDFSPIFLDEVHNVPTASTLLHAASLLTYSTQDISPLYARLSEAEENIASIAEKLHINPEQAQARLKKLTQ